ncbi:MAG: LCCL domain-containing protein [Pseudomonadota bacterium]
MTRYLTIFGLAVLGLLLVPVGQPTEAMQRQLSACPDNAIALRGSGARQECFCSAAASRGGTVWGTDDYSDDSRICRAAVHYGVIGTGGGRVVFEVTPGRSSYQPSNRNGVASRSWGRWQGSFRFVGGGGARDTRAAACPSNAVSLRGTGQSLRCHCAGSATGSGSVWGTDVYTDDSRICRAAVHAGAIGPSGGTVVIRAVSGRASYAGSRRNGVATSNYGRWSGSYVFE